MDLVTPGFGLMFWTTLTFLILLFLLAKFAWKPILGAVKAREKSIEDALLTAEKTRQEMEKLKADNEIILAEARKERDGILKEARDVKDQIINEAKSKAVEEGKKLIDAAKLAIENEKNSAINQIKVKISELSVEIAEKILVRELSDKDKYQDLMDKSIGEIKLN